MKKLIKNGTVISPEKTSQADILIDGERIAAIDQNISCAEAEVFDAAGMLVLPGGVDPHVHISLPMFGTISSDDAYTAGKAAAFGGTTTIIDFVAQDVGSLAENIARKRAESDPLASIDYGLHMNISRFNPETAAEIPMLPSLGVSTVKVFTAYNDRLRLNDGDIFKTMRIAGAAGILTMVHAENGDVIDVLIDEALEAGHTNPIWHARTRPGWGEVEASLRVVALAAQAGAPAYIVHMNMAGEVDQLAYGRAHGVPVMGETCPQYLFFTEAELEREDGAKFIFSPPLRHDADRRKLLEGLINGTIQVLATDHCPFFYDGSTPIVYEDEQVAIPGKELGHKNFSKTPNGAPGVGDRLPLFWTLAVGAGLMTPNQFVAITAANPARIFGLYPQKGCLAVGSDADIAIWDPDIELSYGVTIAQHRTDHNLYEGKQLKGFPRMVFLRGSLLVRDREWFGTKSSGKFLYRKSGEVI